MVRKNELLLTKRAVGGVTEAGGLRAAGGAPRAARPAREGETPYRSARMLARRITSCHLAFSRAKRASPSAGEEPM